MALLLAVTSAAGLSLAGWHEEPPVEVQRGDLVVRRCNGLWSQYFAAVSPHEKRFTHIGIVVTNAPQAKIVHAEAHELTGIGAVCVQSWREFFAEAVECAVFRYDGGERTAEAIAAGGMNRVGVPFDSSFDLTETNRLYCTEFVREVVNAAVGTELIGWTEVGGKRVVSLENAYTNGFTRIFDTGKAKR